MTSKKCNLLISAILFFLFFSLPLSGVIAQSPGAPEVEEFQVVQVFGRQLIFDKIFVAGKDTVLRVVLKEPVNVDKQTQKVTVYVDGNESFSLKPNASKTPVKALEFSCPSRSACKSWAAGVYSFAISIGDNTQTVEGYKFIPTKGIRALAVPVLANYGGKVADVEGAWKTAGDFMKQIYPVNSANFTYRLGTPLDASDSKYDLLTDEGMTELWNALASLQPKHCASNPSEDDCADIILGFVRFRQGKDQDVQGYTMGAPANIITESDQDMLATVAHEVAHLFTIGDEYDKMNGAFICEVNPPPPDYVGRNWDGTDMNYSCPSSTETPFTEGTGTKVDAEKWLPYDVGGRGLLPDMISIMGSGSTQEKNWTTPNIYSHLLKLYANLSDDGTPGGDPTPSAGADDSESSLSGMGLKVARAADEKKITYLYASGFLPRSDDPAKVKLDPWYLYDDVEVKPGGKFDYVLEGLDESGKVLGQQGFKVDFFVHSNPPRNLEEAPFEVGLPYPDAMVRFVIKHKDVAVAERAISANEPQIKLVTAPKTDEKIEGEYTFAWEASDKDGDKLWFDVEYSPDGKENSYYYLATNTTDMKWKENFALHPGGESAKVRITVSDGLLSSEAVTEPFKVPYKPPEVFIDEPANDASFESGLEVNLSGSAYDLQLDDWLTEENQLTWTSDIDGELGQGESLVMEGLSAGKHTITLTATNKEGLSASAKVTINIK